jgi:hypothetical protein
LSLAAALTLDVSSLALAQYAASALVRKIVAVDKTIPSTPHTSQV